MFALGIGHPFVLTEADVVITSLTDFNLESY
jgi:beta-phosphoglucomutase